VASLCVVGIVMRLAVLRGRSEGGHDRRYSFSGTRDILT